MDGLQQVGSRGKDGAVRTEELVGRADEEVRPERAEVHGGMRRVVDAVHIKKCSCVVRQPGDRRDVGHCAEEVRCRRDCHQPRPIAERRVEVAHVQFGSPRIEADPANAGPLPLGCLHPGPDVAVVVEPGHHHLIPRAPARGEVAGEVVGELRCAAPVDDAGRIDVQEVGHGRAELVHDPVGVPLRGHGGAAIGQGAGQRIGYRLPHHTGGLGTTGTVEVGDPRGQRGELGTEALNVEGHGSLSAGGLGVAQA